MAIPQNKTSSSALRYLFPILTIIGLHASFSWRLDWLIWVALTPLLAWLGDAKRSQDEVAKGFFFVGVAYHISLLVPFSSVAWWGWADTTLGALDQSILRQRIFLGFMIFGIAAWAGIVFAAVGRILRRFMARPFLSALVVPCAWVFLIEYLGHKMVFGFSWGLIGNRLHDQEPIRQVASLAGVYGLSFLVVMVNTVAASWIGGQILPAASSLRPGTKLISLDALRVRRISPSLWWATALAVGLLAGGCFYGNQRLGIQPTSGKPVRIALLQGAAPDYTFNDFTAEGFDKLYEPMIEKAKRQGADVIVLPESVWLSSLETDGTDAAGAGERISPYGVTRVLGGILGRFDALIVMGMDAIRNARIYNATTFWVRDGLIGMYEKQRLVPFSEYRPAFLARFAPRDRIHESAFKYTPGNSAKTIPTSFGIFGAFICQEVLYPGLVRNVVRKGAQILLTTGNDGVFRDPTIAREQANIAKLRAIENGRYLIRTMKTGVSAIIDPRGSVLVEAPLNTRIVLRGVVEPNDALTLYTRLGNWLVLLCGIVVGCALLAEGIAISRINFAQRNLFEKAKRRA